MWRPLSASLAALLLLTMASGLAAQATPKAATPAAAQINEPAKATQETATDKDLRLRAETAERNEAIAAAKADLIEAGNSRLENWIGIYGILIAIILAGFGYFSFRSAGDAAAKTAREEIANYKEEIIKIRDDAKIQAGEIADLHLSAKSQATLARTPGIAAETPLTAETEAELKEAAKSASQTPPGERTSQDFRLLMFEAARQEKWDDYIILAEGMAYLHGDNPEDLAFALFGKAFGHLLLKNYELSVSLWEDYFRRCPDDDDDSRAYALGNWGNALSDQAKTQQSDAADALFGRAGEKYAAALSIKPNMHGALYNWGIALFEQAKMKQGDAADALFAQAGEKYAAALAIEPDMHEALSNWGTALSHQAKTKQGEAADVLFAQAGEKFAAALAIKPDLQEALNNWGGALSAQARTKQGDAADALFAQAGEKYAAALAIKPDDHEAHYNWGTALLDQAKTKQGDAADALFGQAGEKYAAALAIKPDYHEALNNWGSALLIHAGRKQGDVALALLEQAEAKLKKSEALKPGWGAYNLACLHGQRGDSSGAAQWLRTAKQLKPNFPDCAHILADTDFATIRDTPEFIAALTDIGCPPSP